MSAFFNDFGRIDFWRVKRRQMRLSWKFSLLNRYFSTTLLYQILFLMILFFKHIFLSILAEFGRFKHIFLSILATFWLILLMRFWQIIFLKGQMTSDRAEIFFSLLNRYFFTTFIDQILFLMILFFKHIFLSILADFGRFCWCDFVDAILFNWVVKI